MRRLQAPPPGEAAPAVAMILPAAAPSSTSAIEAPAVAPPLPELADKPEPLADAMVRQQEIEQLLNSWTTAWQQQDIDAYCAAYSPPLSPRTVRIAGDGSGTVPAPSVRRAISESNGTI